MFERPAHIKRLVDYMIGGWPDQARIDADKIGFFGFSRGGYAGRSSSAVFQICTTRPGCAQMSPDFRSAASYEPRSDRPILRSMIAGSRQP
jgi:hypothetical protein